MASVTLEEKRLKQLKQQLFGKEQPVYKDTKISLGDSHFKEKNPTHSTSSTSLSLKTDLTKIALLSTLALGIQFILFFASKNGLIRLFN